MQIERLNTEREYSWKFINVTQCAISAETFEFRDVIYPLRITATQANASVDFEMRVLLFRDRQRGTRVTQVLYVNAL